jgi:hypothetical protein
MSWKRRHRRQLTEVPLLVERLQKTEQGHHDQSQSGERLSYEEANWAKLSPTFRLAHNRLRQAKGLPTIPPPLVDLYVAPKRSVIRPFDASDKEVQVAIANARFFDGGGAMMGGGHEGFTIKK